MRNLFAVLTIIIPIALHAGDTLGIDPPMRELWTRDNTRFIRQWTLLGPIRAFPEDLQKKTPLQQDLLTSSGGEAAVRPTPGSEQVMPDSKPLRWVFSSSYGDAVDICGGLATPAYRGTQAAPEIAYAYTTVKRDTAGEAVLSIGNDGPCRIWVNGALVDDVTVPTVFSFDDRMLSVHLLKGDNAILVKVEHFTGPMRIAARLLESGTVTEKIDEIVPAIVNDDPSALSVRTDKQLSSSGADVSVQVVRAGGTVLAQSDASRGTVVKFDGTKWPDGAYEIRCRTRTPWGKSFSRYLPWFKGDAVGEAKRLLKEARGAESDPSGGTLRMLAEMVLDRSGGDLKNLPDDGWHRIHSPLMEFEELEMARTNPTAVVRPGGFVRIAYIDSVDGSTQFCRAYLPPEYDPSKKWPLIVMLHGYNPPNPEYVKWWSVDERHSAVAEYHHTIFIEPHARGNTQYRGIGEKDVLRCISEAKRRFNIDDDRVYLTGESMGGSGTWIIASRHPDIFAAAAPVYGGWDSRVAQGFGPAGNALANTPPERFAQETQSSFVSAENLLNVPLFVHHGDADQSVNVEFSRHAVRMLQRWGYDIRYQEMPGWGHEDLDLREAIADWLLSHRRVQAPRHVRLRTPDLDAASAYWVQIEGEEDPFQLMKVDAEVIQPGLISLNSTNVTSIRLSPPKEFLGPAGTLRVVWNGNENNASIGEDGTAVLQVTEPIAGLHMKRPGLEGGISTFIETPFAIVVGTISPDPLMRKRCEEKAEAFANAWESWQHCRPRVLRDRDVTPADKKEYSLLLIGGPDANLIARDISLPLDVQKDAISVSSQRFTVKDAVVQLIYLSPFNVDRYVEVVAGTSAAGLYFWNPLCWHPDIGFPTLRWDWIIRDGREVTLVPGYGPERGWVAAGMFGQSWYSQDRYVYRGDDHLRSSSPLRHAPAEGFTPSQASLNSCAGLYQLYPGVVATVKKEGAGLKIVLPSRAPLDLIPEGEFEYAVKDRGTPLAFERNTTGAVIGLTVNDDGQTIRAQKIQ